MKSFKIKLNPSAKEDIQESIKWYNSKVPGLGKNFHQEIKNAFEAIRLTKFYQVRYDEVRCLPIKKYPYMIHFSVDEANLQIIIRAVFNTHRDPKIWKRK